MSVEIKKMIVEWLHTQQCWVQKAAEKILKNEVIDDKVLDELIENLKCSDGIKTGKLVDFSFFSSTVAEGVDLKIESIGEIYGIDDLAPKTPLVFGESLSVIYGNNGSGKSGYTRILKKICGKPDSLFLISNVFKAPPPHQKCTISINVDNKTDKHEWMANSEPISILQGVDIFDSLTGGSYLEKENESAYMPIEVALFEKLVQVFDALKAKLEKSSTALTSKLPKRPAEFGNSKYIESMYTLLRPDADVERLNKYYAYSDEDELQLKLLEERVKTAPAALASQKEQRKKQITVLIDLISNSSALVSPVSGEQLFELKKDVEVKKKATMDAANALSDDSKLQGIGEATWKSMWQAARKFSEEVSYKGITYPNTEDGSICVLCHQTLDDKAKQRMNNFETYIKGKLQADLKIAEDKYQKKLNELPVKPTEESLKTSIQACQIEEEKWLPIVKEIWAAIEVAKTAFTKIADKAPVGFTLDKIKLNELEELKLKLDDEIATHTKDAESYDLVKIQSELNDLKAKKWASAFTEVMAEEVERLKRLTLIAGWTKLLSTNALTKKANEVSGKVMTEAYIERFNKELKALGAGKISVELVKSGATKGKVKHKLQLKNLSPLHSKAQLRPLSDGEKRIVSLAAFLADVMGKPYKVPFVFDDPISSLDQIYEEKAAERLIELSKDRQVIVFTHRLSLLGLLSEAENAQAKHIRREHWGCGEHGDVPLFGNKPINALKKLKDERLAQAKNELNSKGSDSYNQLAKSICSDFRIIIERVIEHELIGGIVQRHQRGIVTKGKLVKLAKIKQEDCDLLEGLMTEYSKFEHSQSNEAPTDLPEPDKIDAAIKSVLDWHIEFSKRTIQ